MRRARALLTGAVALALTSPGCVTIVSSSQGSPIDAGTVARIEQGKTTLGQVLALLGAPLEVHRHADGRLLVYRHRQRNTFRLGIQPSRALSLIDLTQVTAEAAGNLSLTVERIHAGEDRLMILLGEDEVVRAVGFQNRTHDLPVF